MFNLRATERDIKVIKDHLQKDGKVSDFEKVGRGDDASVFKYNNAVIRRPKDSLTLSNIAKSEAMGFESDGAIPTLEYTDSLIKYSKLAFKKGFLLAPTLDKTIAEDRVCSFAPYVSGPTLLKCDLQDILALGHAGIMEYVKNCANLRKAHLLTNHHSLGDNFIVTGADKKRVCVVDLQYSKTQKIPKESIMDHNARSAQEYKKSVASRDYYFALNNIWARLTKDKDNPLVVPIMEIIQRVIYDLGDNVPMKKDSFIGRAQYEQNSVAKELGI